MSIVKEMGLDAEKNCSVIALQGEIDIFGSEEFKEKIQALAKEHPDKDMLVDMKDLEYIDSTGLGALIGVLKILKPNAKNVIIKEPRTNVLKVFEITNLSKIFHIENE